MLGDASTMAGGESKLSDLAVATRLASDAIARFGFTEHGIAWNSVETKAGSPLVPQHLHAALNELLAAANDAALELLKANNAFLNAVANELIERRVLTHADLLAIDKLTAPPPRKKYKPRPLHELRQTSWHQQTAPDYATAFTPSQFPPQAQPFDQPAYPAYEAPRYED